ncbi:hypothetical protein [Micrococcus luteus]|uniref:hypothetical protein n=1 Tax=Micrococcus luteus TaxID=1270 RepID=UPI00069D412D|nr:hypothetical protein [Micrococcus luteus]MCV7532152.1 hypothetical protein [Micrococcus luteus]TKD53416.1 hypothetical protein FBF74_10460 [Micrococcus luteus]
MDIYTPRLTSTRCLAAAALASFALAGCASPSQPAPTTPTASTPTAAQDSTAAVSPARATASEGHTASSSTRPPAPAAAAPWPGAAQTTYTEQQISDGALGRDETGLPSWPEEVTSTGKDAITFKEWIALNPFPRVYQPAIDWVIEETTTEDRITVQAEKGDILRPLVICQDPAAEVSVGTWEGDTFTASDHESGCGAPAGLPPVSEDGPVTVGYQAPAGTQARLVVIGQDPRTIEPGPPFVDLASPRFLPAGAEPKENLFAPMPWRFLEDLPPTLFDTQGDGMTLAGLLDEHPEQGVLDPAHEQVSAESAGIGVVGPEPAMGGERPAGMIRLSLFCADPFSGPSSVGIQDPATGAYKPLGWSDYCGGYSVTLPRSEADQLAVVADVQEGAAFRLVQISGDDTPTR